MGNSTKPNSTVANDDDPSNFYISINPTQSSGADVAGFKIYNDRIGLPQEINQNNPGEFCIKREGNFIKYAHFNGATPEWKVLNQASELIYNENNKHSKLGFNENGSFIFSIDYTEALQIKKNNIVSANKLQFDIDTDLDLSSNNLNILSNVVNFKNDTIIAKNNRIKLGSNDIQFDISNISTDKYGGGVKFDTSGITLTSENHDYPSIWFKNKNGEIKRYDMGVVKSNFDVSVPKDYIFQLMIFQVTGNIHLLMSIINLLIKMKIIQFPSCRRCKY